MTIAYRTALAHGAYQNIGAGGQFVAVSLAAAQVGDVAIIIATSNDASANGTASVQFPTGWTNTVLTRFDGYTTGQFGVGYRVIQAGDVSATLLLGDTYEWAILIFSGAATPTGFAYNTTSTAPTETVPTGGWAVLGFADPCTPYGTISPQPSQAVRKYLGQQVGTSAMYVDEGTFTGSLSGQTVVALNYTFYSMALVIPAAATAGHTLAVSAASATSAQVRKAAALSRTSASPALTQVRKAATLSRTATLLALAQAKRAVSIVRPGYAAAAAALARSLAVARAATSAVLGAVARGVGKITTAVAVVLGFFNASRGGTPPATGRTFVVTRDATAFTAATPPSIFVTTPF